MLFLLVVAFAIFIVFSDIINKIDERRVWTKTFFYSLVIGFSATAVYTQYFILHYHDYNGIGLVHYAYIMAIYWLLMFVMAVIPVSIVLCFNKVHKKLIIFLVALALPLLMVCLFNDWGISRLSQEYREYNTVEIIKDMFMLVLYPASLIWAIFDKRKMKKQ